MVGGVSSGVKTNAAPLLLNFCRGTAWSHPHHGLAAEVIFCAARTQPPGTARPHHRTPLRRPEPARHAGAARRRPRAAVRRARGRRRRALLARHEGARLARARRAGAGLRPRRPRLHRQRAADPRHRRRAWSAPSSHGRDPLRTRVQAVPAPAPRQPRATSSITTTSPTRSTGCGSTSGWSTRARISAARTTRSTTRRRRSSTTSAASCGWRPGERFLDIGCGWGGLILWAAENYGVDATGITLSQNQFDHVTAEIAARGLTGRVRVELRDYLDLPEDAQFDKVASVGMFEHVGTRQLRQVFRQDLSRAQAGRHGAEPRHHAQRARRPTAWAAASAISSRSTCSPAAS